LVCGGILVLQHSKYPPAKPKFKTPYINGRYVVPLLYLAVLIFFVSGAADSDRGRAWRNFFSMVPQPNEDGALEVACALFKHKIPMLLFIIVATTITVLSFLKKLSLIPVLGLLSCFYLMTQLGITNWLRFFFWLTGGLIIYFGYSRKA